MSTEFSFDGPIESKDTFKTALIELIQAAQANGVDPSGFYESRMADGHKNFEISVIELANE